MCATQARRNPCAASHCLSARIASAATRLTSGSWLGSAVAMPPTGTAPRLRQTATSRRKRSEEHTSELQSQSNLVCRLLLEKKKKDAPGALTTEEHKQHVL